MTYQTKTTDDITPLQLKRWVKKAALYGAGSLVAMMVISGCYYTVAQNEVGAVTRFGSLVSVAPEAPGFHFKMPFADTAHTIRMSIEKFPVPDVKAKTIDNQFVGIDANLTYHTGDPFRALFKVGDVGASGIQDKLVPYVQSRILDEIGKVNALQITDQKGAIEGSILKDVKAQVLDLFGETIDDIQIVGIHYDPVFEQNVQEMVKTRNQQISAQNMLAVRETEAKTAKAVAEGEANAAIARAEGAKQQAIKAAEAAAEQTRLNGEAQAQATLAIKSAEAEGVFKVGEAEANVIRKKTDAVGSFADQYASIVRAEAMKNWKGGVPTYQFGPGGSAQPVLMLPAVDAGK